MREFFRGWKRKVGCVTLLVAFACGLFSDALMASERYHSVGELMRTVTLPLILISAWLLLSKPRVKKADSTAPTE
jgi:hypothetical protein